MIPTISDQSLVQVVDFVLAEKGEDSALIIVGPTVWAPSDGTKAKRWYFMVAYKRGICRCVEVCQEGADRELTDAWRANFIFELAARQRVMIYGTDDELDWVRCCESLWPGAEITRFRQEVEAQRAARS